MFQVFIIMRFLFNKGFVYFCNEFSRDLYSIDLYMKDIIDFTEEDLIRNLKRGSRKAFDDIYWLYSKRLFVYCLRFTKSAEDAEEIVQDVFVRLWMNRENIHQEETLRSLLFIIARHRLINVYRSTVNSPGYEDYVNYQEYLSINNTSAHIEYEEFVKGLKYALRKLPATQQKVIELSRIQGKSNKEVADELLLSEQTVKNQLSLGLKALRGILNKLLNLLLMLLFVN